MQNWKKFILCVSLLGLTPIISACDNNSTVSNLEKLTIVGENHVGLNEYITLIAQRDGNNVDVSWSSSDAKIATISSSGIVKGIRVGKVTITAKLKDDDSSFGTIEIEVHESMQLSLVMNRLYTSAYQITASGSVTVSGQGKMDFSGTDYFYKTSYYFDGDSSSYYSSYGIGQSLNGCFNFYRTNGKIVEATYTRNEINSYRDAVFGLHNIGISSFMNLGLNGESIYDITSYDTAVTAFYYMLIQNYNAAEYASHITTLVEYINKVEIEVTSITSFNVNFSFVNTFKKAGDATLSFSLLEQVEDEELVEYIKSHTPSYPEIYNPIKQMYELLKEHNYIRDLGNYTYSDGTQIPIGLVHYTEDYVYFDFTDEYIEEIKGTQSLYDYGFVNLKNYEAYEDGVYYFTYSNNTLNIGERYENGNTRYEKYYDFYENATLVFDILESKLYTFSETWTGSLDETYKEYRSNALLAKQLVGVLFDDYVTGLELDVEGLLIDIYYDSKTPSNSVFNYGALLGFYGYTFYVYSDYQYTSFGQAGVSIMDDFLAK